MVPSFLSSVSAVVLATVLVATPTTAASSANSTAAHAHQAQVW
ncbi:hypothetical protein PF002_g9501 [Phytophthora fragariae]|uniref:RxLR effector protein n=1 Tax=Phytophthora fragariae TaxID=53985 RepID=A0A6A3ZTT7_9STRA|nr:hypothetical protein PF007_g13511 [Phytophthora fragariae]KAE9240939.1 hypothetical protein PF002_g9501 [Phytophthora fragariae]